MSAGTGTVALSLGLCLCAGQLIATPAASAAAAPVVTTVTAAKPVKPRISSSWSARKVNWGTKVRVTTKLINPKTGKKVVGGWVRLQTHQNGKWKTWLKSRNTSGAVTFATAPHETRWFRTAFGGAGGVTAATTRPTKIHIRSSGARILAEAKKHRGAAYAYGAEGPRRFDCSGYTKYVYKKATGKKLPHSANSQQYYGKKVSKSSKQVGDLIVFRNGSHGYHAGIYAGGGYMYDSPRPGMSVGKHKIWSNNYVVRRIAA
ncbi:cell wall-associated NlpC family hydrolase [Couchioplanes caeruleus]|uniref:Peptidase n=3 Tax=Couchioplanes caeruleus TaxID=56438 RepID=A0A1K0FGH5_9ACTN|nr:peptidase [Couchioplanes caeruleus subsp. caeruleus]ROP29214.1 cell wall-associated NlpC family hydrolase [Couchioplanes caeruleus]